MEYRKAFSAIWEDIRKEKIGADGDVAFSRGGEDFRILFGLHKCVFEHVGGKAKLIFLLWKYSTAHLSPETYLPFVLEIYSLMFKEPLMD